LGEQRFALYAHLQPNSVQVKPGATVRRGQILGRIGNSGNSDAPHLHFHVGQAAVLTDVVTGQTKPIPYVFEKFELRGKYTGKGPVPDSQREMRSSRDAARSGYCYVHAIEKPHRTSTNLKRRFSTPIAN